MKDPKTDIKPLAFIEKSDIAKRAEGAEARAEAKKEAEATAETVRIVFGTSGTYPDGTKWERDATSEETAEYESYTK